MSDSEHDWRALDEAGKPRRVDMAKLKELRAEGVLQPQTLLWRPGMEEWRSAGELMPLLFVEEEQTYLI